MTINITDKTLAVVALVGLVLTYCSLDQRIDQIEQVINDATTTESSIHYTQADLDCLTKNVYYEAGTEDTLGKIAVATVTVNRLKTGYWGHNICDVVYAPNQFSWTNNAVAKPNEQMWYESRHVAHTVLNGIRARGLEHSLYYHADYIKEPSWADRTQRTLQIGSHVFYNRAKNSWLSI
jgi:spore germination cell wall hydrolase CwlJ-like protein